MSITLSDKPSSLNHYDFLNTFLQLVAPPASLESYKTYPNNPALIARITQERSLLEKKIAENQFIAETERGIIMANLQKLTRAQEALLTTPENKKAYDDALSLKTTPIELIADQKKYHLVLVPPTDIKTITAEFHQFAKEQITKNNANGTPYKESDFRYEEKPPGCHTYYFPDQASAEAFMERLFGKNMAMLPGGSQNINDLKSPQAKQEQGSPNPSIANSSDPAIKSRSPDMAPIPNGGPSQTQTIDPNKPK